MGGMAFHTQLDVIHIQLDVQGSIVCIIRTHFCHKWYGVGHGQESLGKHCVDGPQQYTFLVYLWPSVHVVLMDIII